MGWIVTVVVALAAAFPAYAKTAKTAKAKPKAAPTKANRFEAKLLSWQEFVRLPQKKQTRYLNRVRELIVYMEGLQNKYDNRVADNSTVDELKEQVAMLMHMMTVMPQAHAASLDESEADLGPAGTTPAQAVAPAQPAAALAADDVPHWMERKGWVCGEPKFAFDEQIGTCVRMIPGWFGSKNTLFNKGDCPGGDSDVSISEKSQQVRCIPLASWNALTAPRRENISGGVRYPSGYFKNTAGLGPERTQQDVLGGNTHKPDGSLVATGDAAAPPPPPKEEPAKPVAPAATCTKPALACESMSPEEREKTAKSFKRAGKNTPCIIGGVFSTYEAPKKCRPVRSQLNHSCTGANEGICDIGTFCLGLVVDDKFQAYVNGLPEGKQKDSMKNKIDTAFKTKGSGEKMIRLQLCEPIKHETSGVDMSYRCNHSLKAYAEGKVSVFGQKPVGEKYKICNPAELEGGRGDLEHWNEMRANVEKKYKEWCDGKNAGFAAFFCTECGVIAERIIAANKEATGDGCANGEPVQGAPTQPGSPETINEKQGG